MSPSEVIPEHKSRAEEAPFRAEDERRAEGVVACASTKAGLARASGVRRPTRPAGPRTPHRCSVLAAGPRRRRGRAPPLNPRASGARRARRTKGSSRPSAGCGCPGCPGASSPSGPVPCRIRRSAHGKGRRKPDHPARLPGNPGRRSPRGAADASRTGGRGRERPTQASTASPPQPLRVWRLTTGSHGSNPEVLEARDSACRRFFLSWLLRRRGLGWKGKDAC